MCAGTLETADGESSLWHTAHESGLRLRLLTFPSAHCTQPWPLLTSPVRIVRVGEKAIGTAVTSSTSPCRTGAAFGLTKRPEQGFPRRSSRRSGECGRRAIHWAQCGSETSPPCSAQLRDHYSPLPPPQAPQLHGPGFICAGRGDPHRAPHPMGS